MCHKRALFVATCAFAASICSINFVSAEAPNSSSLDFSVDVNETVLEMDISSNNISLDLTPIGGAGVFDSGNTTVTIGTNNLTGYNLNMSMSSPTLNRTESPFKYIPPFPAELTEEEFRNLNASAFAFKINNGNYIGSTSYTYSDIPIAFVTNPTNNDSYDFTFGVKTIPSQAAGTYTNSISYTAVANFSPSFYMQDVELWQDAVAIGQSVKVMDSRDGKLYDVIKLESNGADYLYMQETLKLSALKADGTQRILTSADSDITPNSTYSSFPMPTEAWTSSSQNYFCKAIMAEKNGEVYYNWYAAKANPYVCTNPTSDADATTANDNKSLGSICPAGWTLPNYSTDILPADMWGNGNNPAKIYNSGYFLSGQQNGLNREGNLWSSDRNGNKWAWFFNKYYGTISRGYNDKIHGFSVRCARRVVSKIPNITYMQDFAKLSSTEKNNVLNSMTTNKLYMIKDERDKKDYPIAKMSNGRVYMLETLKLDSRKPDNTVRVLTSTDSDITPNSTYSSFTMPTETWSSTSQNYQCKAIMAVSGGQYFYNWYAAKANPYVCSNNQATSTRDNYSLGSICPAGWTLPNYSSDVTPEILYNNGTNPARLTTAPGYFRSGSRLGAGGQGNLWGSTRQGDNWAWFLGFNGSASRGYNDKDHGFGVRCLLK